MASHVSVPHTTRRELSSGGEKEVGKAQVNEGFSVGTESSKYGGFSLAEL